MTQNEDFKKQIAALREKSKSLADLREGVLGQRKEDKKPLDNKDIPQGDLPKHLQVEDEEDKRRKRSEEIENLLKKVENGEEDMEVVEEKPEIVVKEPQFKPEKVQVRHRRVFTVELTEEMLDTMSAVLSLMDEFAGIDDLPTIHSDIRQLKHEIDELRDVN